MTQLPNSENWPEQNHPVKTAILFGPVLGVRDRVRWQELQTWF